MGVGAVPCSHSWIQVVSATNIEDGLPSNKSRGKIRNSGDEGGEGGDGGNRNTSWEASEHGVSRGS